MKVLLINDISCAGRCSLTVAHPILTACSVKCDLLPTALLSTHTGGFEGYTFLDLSEEMEKIVEHWKTLGHKYDIIYCGYLGNRSQIGLIKRIKADLLKEGGIFALDPVLGDNGKLYANFDEPFVEEMKSLCAQADYIFPNVTEAALLSETPLDSISVDALYKLKKYCPNPIITGNIKKDKCEIYFGDGKTYCTRAIEGIFHGTGDLFASAFVAALANGLDDDVCVKISADFVLDSILNSDDVSDRRYGVNFEGCIPSLIDAIKRQTGKN